MEVGSDTWQEEMRRKLQHARQTQANFDTVVGPLRITKKTLAEALWPVLLAKVEHELAADAAETPVPKVMLEARRLVGLLSSGTYMLSPSDDDDASGIAGDQSWRARMEPPPSFIHLR
jgi:hypothetical protein